MSYVLLPGIVPRAKALFASGFGMIAFFMASLYGMVRLLPPNHPYLNAANIGKFGIRHVIAEAANHLVVKRENIDQIVIFTALMTGAVLLFLQFGMLAYSFLVPSAHAQVFSLFSTPSPQNDIAFLLLDHVFGVPRMFCSHGQCSHIQGTLPVPFHDALHALFQFYSIGLLCIGVLIFLYFVVVVVVETAVSGTPFGQRFDNIWVPIRLVVALALLVPVNWGLNSAQYITLFAAKMGSGFATNAWLTFNDTILQAANNTSNGSNPLGEQETLIAIAKQQDSSILVQEMSLVHSCAYAYLRNDRTGRTNGVTSVLDSKAFIRPYFVKGGIISNGSPNFMEVTSQTTYKQALDFFNNKDIVIRWGEHGDQYGDQTGKVFPTCGEIRIKATPLSDPNAAEDKLSGAEYISTRYFNIIKQMWFTDAKFRQFAIREAELNMPGPRKDFLCGNGKGCSGAADDFLPACSPSDPDSPCMQEDITTAWRQNVIDTYQSIMNADLLQAWHSEAANAPVAIDQDVLQRGWAGAGIWYNKIAELNGAFMGAVLDLPAMQKYPSVMEKVRAERRKQDSGTDFIDQFSPKLSGDKDIKLEGQNNDLDIAKALNAVFQYWNTDDQNQANQQKTHTGNIFEDAVNMMFGTSGLLDIRKENAHTHPLAQLVAVGKGLVEGTLRNMAISTVSAMAGGFLAAMQGEGSLGAQAAGAISSFFMSVSFVGLTAGLTLFYVLPFLPFVYFYFTVGTWIKTIFEAMVGVPLWALAHLRLDGNGLSGQAAVNGYILIFEIFLRPILAVFGLIAGILIFSAQVRILNFIWELVTNNMTGYNDDPNFSLVGDIHFKRSIIDQFFFTVIYTIIVYILAIASFKLIDRIPDNITRWLGAGVSTFSDINDDAAEGLKRYVAMGGLTFGQQITGGITDAARGIGGTAGKLAGGDGGRAAAARAAGGPRPGAGT